MIPTEGQRLKLKGKFFERFGGVQQTSINEDTEPRGVFTVWWGSIPSLSDNVG